MRLAEGPAPLRAGGQADVIPAVSAVPAGPTGPAGHNRSSAAGRADSASPGARGSGDPAFDAAVAALEAGRDAVATARDDFELEAWPAPKRLAPLAVALAVTAFRDGEEAGEGKLMLLYDPVGRDGWTGTFRVVVQVQADVDEEMAADPLLGEVGWSWLTDALNLHAPGYGAPSGTVTRVITEGYGSKSDDPSSTGFELRASWCPAGDAEADGDELAAEVSGAVVAWCELLASAAGLPATGTLAIGRRASNTRAGGAAGRGALSGASGAHGGRRRR